MSETLRSITSTKIQELKKQREQYEASKSQILHDAKPYHDELDRTAILLDGACRHAGVPATEDDGSTSDSFRSSDAAHRRRNQQMFLRQAKKDPSLGSHLVHDIQNDLLDYFELKSVQHEHAHFFSQLVTEWLSSSADEESAKTAQGVMEDSTFESVGRKEMHEQRAQWESIVFSQADVDGSKVKEYMHQLFQTEKVVSDAFKDMEESTKSFCSNLWHKPDFFDTAGLKTTIKGLLQTDLLSEEKAAILKSFKNNNGVLQEVADVLNMRYASLETWQWSTINGAISVHQRRQLNGKYRVFMDEDVLDALLLHAVGMNWAVHFKNRITVFFRSLAWKTTSRSIPKIDQDRRAYFLGDDSGTSASVEAQRKGQYEKDFFMAQLPISEDEGTRAYGDEDDDVTAPSRKSPVETKQSLLHLVITEALVARHLRPGMPHAVIRSDFQWFGPSLPHETIFAVLEVFGMSQPWLDFFRKFLQAPMRFAQDGPGGQFQARQRGVPMSHALSDVFGEVILFVMDFAVNHATRSYLYRLHDDFWFWGSKGLCVRGWEAMTKFASVMGLAFNQEKTGTVVFEQAPGGQRVYGSSEVSALDTEEDPVTREPRLPKGDIRWGFLRLDAASVRFVVDQSMVDEHIIELQRQLSHCTSIFSYIQAYNAYLARFFSNNLGQPCFAFGREHIDDMINTFARIQRAIFPKESVTDYLARLAHERFGVKDLPDAFWYWPVQMGGLEVRNPMIPLYCMRETMRKTPPKILKKSDESEESLYAAAKARFELKTSVELRQSQVRSGVSDLGERFMSIEEFLRYREERATALGGAYKQLLSIPLEYHVRETNDITSWLEKLPPAARGSKPAAAGIGKKFRLMKPYWKWILAVYGGQVVEKYGNLQIVDAAQVPLGVVSVMKAIKVKWQG